MKMRVSATPALRWVWNLARRRYYLLTREEKAMSLRKNKNKVAFKGLAIGIPEK
jgi:hypothetical protein